MRTHRSFAAARSIIGIIEEFFQVYLFYNYYRIMRNTLYLFRIKNKVYAILILQDFY